MRFTRPSRRLALDEELCLPQAWSGIYPPCRTACPVGTDARGYMEAIAYGRYEEAFRIAREPNPIVSACAWICPHPCEEACRREAVDEPVSIRGLKRFALEWGRPSEAERMEELAMLAGRAGDSGRRVAIVGSGPAGLAAAERLALGGHSVTVYERRAFAGGQLANAIPLYRLPRTALAVDVAEIEALGVEIRTGIEVGTDVTLPDLAGRHDAVVLAIGLSGSRGLPVEGMDADSVHLALPFLEACVAHASGRGPKPPLGRHVIVVGGGNVAVDVARSAVRLGRESVTMVCLESSEEMPAWSWELEEAADEGVSIRCSLGPKRILVEAGRCAGLETKAVKCVFDEHGRFAPEFFEDEVDVISGDTVIVAIGQQADYRALEGGAVELDGRGRLMFDATRMVTSQPGVFACGEVVTGPGAAIAAAASGQRAAEAVQAYLASGVFRHVASEERMEVEALPERVAELVPVAPRRPLPQVCAEERRNTFDTFEDGFDQAAALAEARRCMLCGAGAAIVAEKCASCVTCERVCPFGAPSVKGSAWIPAVSCQACGICVIECPAAAIDMAAVDPWEARDAIAAALVGRPEGSTLVVGCAQHRRDWEAADEDTIECSVTCAGRLRVGDVLHAYELGARKVVVSLCADGGVDAGGCRFARARERALRRLSRVPELLPQMGLDFESFEVVEGGGAA